MSKATKAEQAPLNDFGRALAAALKRWGGTRKDFLHEFRLENKTLRRYETSDTLPRIDQIQEWAEFLGCDPADLIPASRFCGVTQALVEYENEKHVRWAAERAGLDERQRRRLFDVRHSVGPMTEDQLLAMANSIKKNAATEGFAHPKAVERGAFVAITPIGDEARLDG